ncbi:hypothetical protein LINPERPRIM_LOCUS3009 [Linum perenne]
MNAVDSALDPLVFDYINCGISDIVNNLWTWVALLTAAVSFWTIRAPSSPPRRRLNLQVPKSGLVLRRDIVTAAGPVEVEEPPKTPASSPIVCDDEDVVTKGKFVTYYREMEEVEEVEEEEERCGGEKDNGGGGGYWEAELRLKVREELGWYRYQDLTEINGNVVRLWDGVRRGDGVSYRKTISSSSVAVW